MNPVSRSMLSLDARSLFTNVLMDGSLTCLETRLRDFHKFDIEVEDCINLSKLCITHTAFEFNSRYYKKKLMA